MKSVNQPTEISEYQATGEIAVIFEDIRRSFRSPIVNQIYRRIAGIPGCLDWAWSCVGPVVGSGDLEREAKALLVQLRIDRPKRISLERLRTEGIDKTGVHAINRVLDAYNRTNPMNLIAVNMLATLLAMRLAAPPRREQSSDEPDTVHYILPALIEPESMDRKTRDDLSHLARLASGGSADVIPTLFRHFGEWPRFLAVARDAITPLGRDDMINLAAKEFIGLAMVAASKIAPGNLEDGTAAAAPFGREAAQLEELLARFSSAISRMIVIGYWLRLSMPK